MDIKDQIKMMKRVARDQRLENERENGRPRSNSWGGRKNNRQLRREVKRELSNAH